MDQQVNDIQQAHLILQPHIRLTPLDYSPLLSHLTQCQVYLKGEHLQHTGSFKFRGAMNKLSQLPSALHQAGVITASTGNHGKAMALAGQRLNIAVTVYAPVDASPSKLDAIRAYGSQIVLVKGDALTAECSARAQARVEEKEFISPYNDRLIIAGQGTIGLELLQQLPTLDAVFIAVGGGGLISGIGSIIKHLSPTTQIIGCWPKNAAALYYSLQQGEIIEIEEQPTLSDGTAGGVEPGAITFPICQQVIDRTILVSEEEIQQAMKLLAETDQWIIEGAAGVAVAAFLQVACEYQHKHIAIVLCGRNITLDRYITAIT